jgi:PEP-CTERM motif
MRVTRTVQPLLWGTLLFTSALPAIAGTVFFSTGDPNNLMAMASRPGTAGKLEIEAADDFFIGGTGARIDSATFTGLITNVGVASPTIGQVVVELYNIFPVDSDTGRAIHVPTRTNSPSDVDFSSRDSIDGTLSFTTTTLAATSTAANSVLNGINPSPNQTTNGEGPVTGAEVRFGITFNTPIFLAPGHYFFIPQVQVTGGEFFWLSAARPIVAPGTPFPQGTTDLQTWIRNANLDPDWLRVGTDIVGAGAFNGTFSLTGVDANVPEPGTVLLMSAALAGLLLCKHRYTPQQ